MDIEKQCIEINMGETPEKFQHMKDELLDFLLSNLRSLCQLEEEFYVRNEQLDKDKVTRLGLPRHHTHPESGDMWNEYSRRFLEIVTPICTQSLLKRGFARSIGNPAEYAYLNTGCKISFIMKSANRAAIETSFKKGTVMKHQFILKKTEDGWKIDSKKYGFADEDTWYIDGI